MIKKNLLFISFTFIILGCASAENYKVSSPDGKAILQLYCTPTALSYSLSWEKETIAEQSAIHFFENPNYKVLGKKDKEIKPSWKPVWGQFRYQKLP